jgi:hypothetical protein
MSKVLGAALYFEFYEELPKNDLTQNLKHM